VFVTIVALNQAVLFWRIRVSSSHDYNLQGCNHFPRPQSHATVMLDIQNERPMLWHHAVRPKFKNWQHHAMECITRSAVPDIACFVPFYFTSYVCFTFTPFMCLRVRLSHFSSDYETLIICNIFTRNTYK